MAQGLCSGRIPIEWSYVCAGVDLVGELLLEAVRLIESCAGAGAGAGADLGPDKIRDRPHTTMGGRSGWSVGGQRRCGARRSLEGGSCSGMGLSWAGPRGLENGPGLNAAGLQCYPQCAPCSVPFCSAQVRWPFGPVPSPLVAWTTASDRLKKDPGRAPQHDRGRHWPAVEATGPSSRQ